MRKSSIIRFLALAAAGAALVQTTGCTTFEFLQFAQTVFLGITAAGAIAILQNI